ncbi:SDR family oxidoreductase [Paracoccus liaowanqingii]|uniref:SDR family oxidoreductase n=1 Tax=Paracoccus liaowanqingii TaxID=2560053 RepID=A0A4Z1CDR5_9RHOB|nr:SDR family NAD(P)-dependent oxidoreductase [Paracoccus liaowanqingii]TGN45877.1 SDR family oxidoreductase [Paracoccus liaowanqingii]
MRADMTASPVLRHRATGTCLAAGGRQVAVITGAGLGLGRALSVELTRRGVHVAGIGRDPCHLAQTGDLCVPGQFTALRGDVSQPGPMRELAAQVEAQVGPVSIVVNNAAIYRRQDFLGAVAEEVVDHVMVNTCGPINVTAAFMPGMLDRGRGRIINVSSFAGGNPLPGSLGYTVSKAGARVFSQALTVELARRMPHITVTEWIPGIMATRTGRPSGIPPETVAAWGATLALDDSPDLHGAIFLCDAEMLPPRSLRRRVKDALLLKPSRRPRILAPAMAPAPALADPRTGDPE